MTTGAVAPDARPALIRRRTTGSSTRRSWVVVAPHREPRGPDGARPWGTAHLKRVGDDRTACGVPALTWRGFWHLGFGDVETPCDDCAAAGLRRG